MSQGYGQQFIVEVTNAPEVVPDVYRAALAEAFSLSPQKADQLMRRLPGIVTKPVAQNEAEQVAGHFRRAGLNAVVRPATDGLEQGIFEREQVMTAAPPILAAAPTTTDPVRSSYLDDEDDLFSHADLDGSAVPDPVVPPDTTPNVKPQSGPEIFLDGAALSEALDKTLNTQTEPVSDRFKVDLSMLAPAVEERANTIEDGSATAPAASMTGSVRRQLFGTAITPVILMLLGVLAVIWFTVRPVLEAQLLSGANDALTLTASSLNLLIETDMDVDALLASALGDALQFQNEVIQAVVLADETGQLASSWLSDTSSPTILRQVEAALPGLTNETTVLATPSGERLHIMGRELIQAGDPVGRLVIAVSDRTVTEQVLRLLAYVGVFSLLPLALALALLLLGVRPLLKRLRYLTDRADAISRGDFGDTVRLDSRDELGRLAEALERLRISMEEALTRLRQRR